MKDRTTSTRISRASSRSKRITLLAAGAVCCCGLLPSQLVAATSFLFKDTLTTSTWETGGNVNVDLAIRQAGGGITGVNYTSRLDFGPASDIQTGRPGAPPTNGIYFEKAGQTIGNHRYVSPSQNFNSFPVALSKFTIGFGGVTTTNTSFWNGISILGNSASRLWETHDPSANGGNNGNKLGILWKGNSWQLFKNETLADSGSVGSTISSIAFDVSGGTFGGAAFNVGLLINGSSVATTTYSSSDNYISFGSTFTHTGFNEFQSAAYQNLSISYLPAGGGNWTGADDATDGIAGPGGNWNTDGNWSSGSVPTASGDTTFNLNNTYTVNFTAPAAANIVTMSAGTVTFNMNNNQLSLADFGLIFSDSAANLTVTGDGTIASAGRIRMHRGTMNISGGSEITSSNYFAFGNSNGNATVTVDGTGSAIRSTASQIEIGEGTTSSATVNLTNGAQLTANTFITLATQPTGAGTLNVTNSTVQAAEFFVGGYNTFSGGAGTLNINTGATVIASGLTKVWNNSSKINLNGGTLSTGTLDTIGTPSRFNWTAGTLGITNSTLMITSGLTGPLGNDLTIGANKTLLTQGLTIGTLTSGAGSVTVSGGGRLNASGGIFVGITGGNGTLIVDGANSVLTTTSSTAVGSGGLGGTLTIRNGGAATFNNGLVIASTLSNNSAGTLLMQSGGSLTVNRIEMAPSSNPNTGITARATIDNAAVAVNGHLTLAGNTTTAGNGLATFTIQNNGSVAVSGLTRVWNNGTIILTGGTLTTGTLETGGVTSRFYDNWTAGTLDITASNLKIMSGQTLGSSVALGGGAGFKALIVREGFTLGVGDSSAGTLNVSGGYVNLGESLAAGQLAGGSGTILVSAGSVNTAGALYLGGNTVNNGGGNGRLILSGGSVNVAATTKLYSTGTLIVTGGSLTTQSLDLASAGSFSFTGGTITINGGAMTPKLSTVSVNFAPSASNQSNSFDLNGVSTATLTIQAGGTLSSAASNLFVGHSGKSGFMRIDGATSSLALSSGGILYLGAGRDSAGVTPGVGTLILTNGGQSTSAGSTLVGSLGGKSYASVEGNNSKLASSGNILYVGDTGFIVGSTFYASEGTLNLTNGGQATSNNAAWIGNFGGKGYASVDGANSKLASTGDNIVVGLNGFGSGTTFTHSEGTLSLTAGGQASGYYDVSVGAFGGKGRASVDGVGSVIRSEIASLRIGSSARTIGSTLYGSEGTLILRNGGQAIATQMLIGNSAALGWLSVEGGIVSVPGILVGTGAQTEGSTVYAGQGTVTVSAAGAITSSNTVVGAYGGNGSVALTGLNTTWTNGSLFIGYDGGTGAGQGTFAVTDGAVLTNSLGLNVAATGRLILGSNSRISTGILDLKGAPSNFTWTGGTLKINTFAPAADGLLTVPNTGTLGGTGNIQRPVTVAAGGTLAPGNSVGAITTGNLNLNSASDYFIELDITANTADKTVVNGTVNLNGTPDGLGGTVGGAKLQFVFLTGSAPLGTPRSFVIIENDGTDNVSGLFNNILENATYTLGQAVYSVNYHGGSGNDVILTINEVPEPGTLALPFAALFLTRRRAARRR